MKKKIIFGLVAVGAVALLIVWYKRQINNAYVGGIDAGQKDILGF